MGTRQDTTQASSFFLQALRALTGHPTNLQRSSTSQTLEGEQQRQQGPPSWGQAQVGCCMSTPSRGTREKNFQSVCIPGSSLVNRSGGPQMREGAPEVLQAFSPGLCHPKWSPKLQVTGSGWEERWVRPEQSGGLPSCCLTCLSH